MIKISFPALLIFFIALSACNKKNISGIKAGSYFGTAHEYGSYSFSSPNGTETGATDTTYEEVLTIEMVGADSVKFIFQKNQATYKLLEKNAHYCRSCDPTRNLDDYQAIGDSVYYHFHLYGGSGSNFSTSYIDFAGALH